MHFGIIAAGEGSRLAAEGINQPKPLVPLNGTPMIERLIDIMVNCHAESVSVIINEQYTAVGDHLRSLRLPVPLNIVVRTTPSSMHSFYHLSQIMPEGKICLTTVDTIFRPDDFAAYVSAFETDTEHDGLWAVTPFIDDEKPLYVEVDSNLRITAFRDRLPESAGDRPVYVSGGIYAMRSERALPVLEQCIEQGQSRMRNFQRALVAAGLNLAAYPIEKIIDVDHAADIATAEAFLNS